MERLRESDVSPKTDKWGIKQRSQKLAYTQNCGFVRGSTAVGERGSMMDCLANHAKKMS